MGFLIRTAVAAGVATWLLRGRLQRHDIVGAVLIAAVGYGILPVIAYFHTRYYNLRFISGAVETVRKKFCASSRGAGDPK